MDVFSDLDQGVLDILKQNPNKMDVVIQNVTAADKPWKKADIGSYTSGNRGIWDVGPGPRGEAIERRYGHNVPANYPDIDKWDAATGTATSIKSIDMTSGSYNLTDADQLYNKLKSAVKLEDLHAFKGYTSPKLDTTGQVQSKVLELIIPREATTAVQEAALQRLARVCQRNGINFTLIRDQF